jgi:two-component system, OmpR family, response regulator
LRRRESAAGVPAGIIAEFAGWRLDLVRRELRSPDGVLINLSDGEFGLLRVFVERAQQVLTRDELLELARGRDSDAYDRAIDVQISRLRRKLDDASQVHDALIRTIRNEGYVFTPKVVRR